MTDDKIKLIITAEVTGSACNFDCNYCYRKNQSGYEKNIKPTFEYSLEDMLKSFSKKKLGGTALIFVIGGGETLLPDKVVPLVKGLLDEGHIVEIVTNLSLNKRVDELLTAPKEDLERLIVKGSFHYLELKRLNKLEDYFNNMRKIVKAGASTYPLITICEEYLPYLDDIKNLFLNELGELPHCIPAVKDFDDTMATYDFYNQEFINKIKADFNSNVFDCFTKTVNILPAKHFCYAGERSIVVNLNNGKIRKCFYTNNEGDLFKGKKFKTLSPIGNCCSKKHCALLYCFLGPGLIPTINTYTYGEMIAKDKLFNPKLKQMLNIKFSDYLNNYTDEQQQKLNNKHKNGQRETLFTKIMKLFRNF